MIIGNWKVHHYIHTQGISGANSATSLCPASQEGTIAYYLYMQFWAMLLCWPDVHKLLWAYLCVRKFRWHICPGNPTSAVRCGHASLHMHLAVCSGKSISYFAWLAFIEVLACFLKNWFIKYFLESHWRTHFKGTINYIVIIKTKGDVTRIEKTGVVVGRFRHRRRKSKVEKTNAWDNFCLGKVCYCNPRRLWHEWTFSLR